MAPDLTRAKKEKKAHLASFEREGGRKRWGQWTPEGQHY